MNRSPDKALRDWGVMSWMFWPKLSVDGLGAEPLVPNVMKIVVPTKLNSRHVLVRVLSARDLGPGSGGQELVQRDVAVAAGRALRAVSQLALADRNQVVKSWKPVPSVRTTATGVPVGRAVAGSQLPPEPQSVAALALPTLVTPHSRWHWSKCHPPQA